MRISDWSSDVCSSDLPGGQKRAEVVNPTPIAPRATARMAGLPVEAQVELELPPSSTAQPQEVRLTASRMGCEHPPRRQPLRSEEHTSELQSLMRISYAVFCLKKKKNHI